MSTRLLLTGMTALLGVGLLGGSALLMVASGADVFQRGISQLVVALVVIMLFLGWNGSRRTHIARIPPWRSAETTQQVARRQRLHGRERWRLHWLTLQAWWPTYWLPQRLTLRRWPKRAKLPTVRTIRVRPRRLFWRMRTDWLPWPALELEFVSPGSAQTRPHDDPFLQTRLYVLVEQAIQVVVPHTPIPIVALHTHPRALTVEFAPTPLLEPSEQRDILSYLREQGILANWSDTSLLTMRRYQAASTMPGTLQTHPATQVHWLPIARNRQTTIWWPLPAEQHVLIAGRFHETLAGLLQRRMHLPEANQPLLLIHDPHGRIAELETTLGSLPSQADAIQQARQLQLQYRFLCERDAGAPDWVAPLCIIVEPNESHWPELQPLLEAKSGVQVILVLGHRPPIAALRVLCYRIAVIESAEGTVPPLPDTFRPPGLPAPRAGQVVAWMAGGKSWWRGRSV